MEVHELTSKIMGNKKTQKKKERKMRLKKAEKDQLIQQIYQVEEAKKNDKVVNMRSCDTSFAWFRLGYDHYCRLSLNLRHIYDDLLIDRIREKTGKRHISTEEYIKHYSDSELDLIYRQLIDAKRGLYALEEMISQEVKNRANKEPTKIAGVPHDTIRKAEKIHQKADCNS